MANKSIFKTNKNVVVVADTFNEAGGNAYSFSDKQKLAQLVTTNCFNGTFYASAESNLEKMKAAAIALKNDPKFIAKVVVYARKEADMKDAPAFLTVMLAGFDSKLFRKIFPIVIDNGKMLRNFIQIARSGATGKVYNVSSGTIRHAIRDWFADKSSEQIFRASIGNDPPMRDILRMSHPRPNTPEKAALFAYLNGVEEVNGKFVVRGKKKKEILYANPISNLPKIVKEFEAYKKNPKGKVPNVDFRMLDSLNLGTDEWVEIARNANWTTTRMNLNTFARHGVFEEKGMDTLIANRIKNPEEIKKAAVYPYQLMAAWMATSDNAKIPFKVRDALQDAMETSIDNVPQIDGKIYLCVDTSGSMSSAITGTRTGSTSKIRCIDVAALFAAALLRRNRDAEVIPFDTVVHPCNLNGRDSVLTNAEKLAKYGGGGTNCSAALASINAKGGEGDLVIYISDNQSWADRYYGYYGTGSTGMAAEWAKFKSRNKNAKLICIDLAPNTTAQVNEKADTLLVGGFGDSVFDAINSFVNENSSNKNHWVEVIENVEV
jgi:60 kDa SS-A/Ro ribonucleoprotein